MDFISGEVSIKVSGATGDYPLPARLSREIEAAVCDVLERDDPFHSPASDASDDTPRTPDDRPIDDISAVSECGSCGWAPASIILTQGGWECYNCGAPPGADPEPVMCDGGVSLGDRVECPYCTASFPARRSARREANELASHIEEHHPEKESGRTSAGQSNRGP